MWPGVSRVHDGPMHRVSGRPQVVAHRGSSLDEPEHTLAAYVAALDAGAEGLECDVRLTADGHLVCVHDRRVDRTANGRGVVSSMELAELDALDFASWKNPWADLDDEAPEVDEETRRVLTLRRLLEVSRDYDRPVDLAIETKHPTRYGGLVERRLVELLEAFGWGGAGSPARVMSFSAVALARVRRLAPELEVVLLLERPYTWQVATSMLAPGWIAGPSIELLRDTPTLADRLRGRGRRVHGWVVNDPADLDLCTDLGVEAVMTDDPRWAMAHFSRPSPGHRTG
jgi:glycerophosphoryl diester phosphodiesterase